MGKFSECHYCVVVNKDVTNESELTEVIVNRQCTDGNGNPDETFYEVFNLKTKRNEYYPESRLEWKHEYVSKINSDEMRKYRAATALSKHLIGENGCVDIVDIVSRTTWFVEGYMQGERDFELTPDDVGTIFNLVLEGQNNYCSTEFCYEDVAKTFNMAKKLSEKK